MKTALVILPLIIISFIVLFIILGVISRSGKPSGLIAGRLAKCPDTPNCVCSEQYGDADHFIHSISLPQNISFDPLAILKNVVQDMDGVILIENDRYFAATFSSSIFGFMDDLEVRLDLLQKVIHIRSASRVGYGDAGVNRKRTDLLKKLYDHKVLALKQ